MKSMGWDWRRRVAWGVDWWRRQPWPERCAACVAILLLVFWAIAVVLAGYEAVMVHSDKEREPYNEGTPAAQQQTSNPGARNAYGRQLRETFLDKGINIEVWVEGDESDEIGLYYILMDPVWYHHFKKGPLPREMAALGFKTVVLKGHKFGRQIELSCGAEYPSTCARP